MEVGHNEDGSKEDLGCSRTRRRSRHSPFPEAAAAFAVPLDNSASVRFAESACSASPFYVAQPLDPSLSWILVLAIARLL